MQAHTDDRIVQPRNGTKAPFVILALLLVAGGAGYLYWQNSAATTPLVAELKAAIETPVPQLASPAAVPAATLITPAIAPVTPVEQVTASEPPLVPAVEDAPLPLLDESDAAVKTIIRGMVGASLHDALAAYWQGDNLIRRFVAFVANLAEGKLDSKSSPLSPPKARFAVTASKPLIMTTESQRRFNPYVLLITSIDPSTCAAAYRRHYPLLHSAYADLGENKSFHGVMLAAIDRLLATPELLSEPELVSAEKGLFKFVDPALEGLPAAQKPLLRMGRENAGAMKRWLRQVRTALLAVPVAPAPAPAGL